MTYTIVYFRYSTFGNGSNYTIKYVGGCELAIAAAVRQMLLATRRLLVALFDYVIYHIELNVSLKLVCFVNMYVCIYIYIYIFVVDRGRCSAG